LILEEALRSQYKSELTRLSMLPYYDKSKQEMYFTYKMNHRTYSWIDTITYVNIGLDKKYYTDIQVVDDSESVHILVNKYRQLGDNYIPNDLEVIHPDYNSDQLKLRHEARCAFEKMCRAASAKGICLKAISTFRSYYYQWKVYLNNITPDISIDEYRKVRDKVSARPGHSEHQTGLAVDINDLEQSFEYTMEGKWLAENAYLYGFILRYPKGKEHITGYDFEPWHYRYLGVELAEALYCSELTYDEFYIRYLETSK